MKIGAAILSSQALSTIYVYCVNSNKQPNTHLLPSDVAKSQNKTCGSVCPEGGISGCYRMSQKILRCEIGRVLRNSQSPSQRIICNRGFLFKEKKKKQTNRICAEYRFNSLYNIKTKCSTSHINHSWEG